MYIIIIEKNSVPELDPKKWGLLFKNRIDSVL